VDHHYITGSLSLIDNLLLVRLTQINFIENTRSSPHKTSSYAWEKREENEPTIQSNPSATEIAKTLSAKSNKRKVKNQATTLSRSQKIPKLSSLALPQLSADDNPQEEASSSTSHSNIDYNPQDDSQPNISDDRNEQESEIQPQRKTRGKKKK
jgi:hypothetical protein